MLQNFEQKLRNNNGFAATLLDLYILVNLTFLGLDVFIAHSINAFASPAEWIPFYFSLAAALLMTPIMFSKNPYYRKWCRLSIGGLAIAVGITGMLLHLSSGFFTALTLKSLVYAAPFVAPLAYTGIGMLLITNQIIPDTERHWAEWITFLAGAGWCGNFLLSAIDHAQNGFFVPTEWIPVITSALAVGYLLTHDWKTNQTAASTYGIAIFTLNFFVGITGSLFHLIADLQIPATRQIDRFLYGAPLLAPLLFPNLSLLAILGIWKISNRPTESTKNS